MSAPSKNDAVRFDSPAIVRPWAVWLLVALALIFSVPLPAIGQPADVATSDEDDDNPYRPGLIARYRGADGAEHVRLEEEVLHAWDARSPDRRMPPGPFTAHYSGRLWAQSPGMHRLHVFAAGSVRLELGGKVLLEVHAPKPQWIDAQPIELPFGFHPLEIEYVRADEPARLALYWEGPQFELEPVAARWLFHDAGQTPSGDFERGEMLVRALRCTACHALPGEPDALRGPALESLAGNLSRSWFVDWLSGQPAGAAPSEAAERSARRMPHFGFDREQAASIADALLAASEPPPAEPAVAAPEAADKQIGKEKKPTEEEPPPPSAAAGATQFYSVGCLACHRVGELGTDGLFGGGDLSHVADKRPADYFARWLSDPAQLNRDHRMPGFKLESHELASLSLYLQTLHAPATPAAVETPSPSADGAQLVRQGRCASCHVLPKSLTAQTAVKPAKLELAALERAANSCLFEPDSARLRPGYRLGKDDRLAIQSFISGVSRGGNQPATRDGGHLLVEQNCLACHARGLSPGIAGHLPAVAEADAELRDVLAALEPPALFGIGDKLRDEALAAAIRTPETPQRPWLHVRMPKFPLSSDDVDLLASYFVAADRIPPRDGTTAAESASLPETSFDTAGPRLVTADGFGCTSCHAIGQWTPQKVALNAHGSALDQIGLRVRREWFDRWVRNPSRIVPRMEMPAVQQSIRGVLDEKIDTQLAAVWHVLNREGFTPPAPDALRVVRRSNLPELREPAAVLTDVIEVTGVSFVKPLVIGLENRHNVLLNLANNRLAAWWIGDAARQTTSGKTWYWESGVPQLLAVDDAGEDSPGDLLLLGGSQTIAPLAQGAYVTEFDTLEHVDSGVRFSQRLYFPTGGHPQAIRVVQEFHPLPAQDGETGFRRRVQLERAASDAQWQLVVLPGDATLDASGRKATLVGPHGAVEVELAAGDDARLVSSPRGTAVVLGSAGGEPPACELEYRSQAAPDQYTPRPDVDRIVDRAELKVVPGFEAVRLPLTVRAMPTGLAWRGDGTLVVSSLEGRVWLGHDDDGDGLEDRLVPFSDELAAPYGVAAADDAVDVSSKFGLLRLFDADGDGRAERTELLASGWGHTRDYHDWAAGLPRDAAGNYYVSLGCQQDDRSEEEARFRGHVLKLVPRQPTADDPRQFTIEDVAGGFRFPQGIALSRAGELFVTDQQGHYTPFNELNHVLPGTRYGYVNSLEVKRGLDAPFKPAAVEIPYPWTRSVNGICFLETPEAVREKLGRDLFGPFEGHLLGCEYTTLRLVRMSLERIGDDFQGAVYPLTVEPAPDAETFEGPLVCQIAPDGDLYVGNIRDSGWGAGSNTGSIVRLRRQGDLPCGIAEVRAARDGFSIEFTQPVDRDQAAEAGNYAVSSFRRVPTPAYGGDDRDRRVETIRAVAVSDDARRVSVQLDSLREGFVYEFHLRNLAGGKQFFPDEAYYTLHRRAL